jgi:hypothetical protein
MAWRTDSKMVPRKVLGMADSRVVSKASAKDLPNDANSTMVRAMDVRAERTNEMIDLSSMLRGGANTSNSET